MSAAYWRVLGDPVEMASQGAERVDGVAAQEGGAAGAAMLGATARAAAPAACRSCRFWSSRGDDPGTHLI
jgi:hypothetical protein